MDFDSKFDIDLTTQEDIDLQFFLESDFLRQRIVVDAKLLGGGFRNNNYRLQLEDGQCVVLRIFRRKGDSCQMEQSLLKRIKGIVPVPEVLFSTDSYMILEYLPGEQLCAVEDTLSSRAISTIGAQLGDCLARIHNVSFPCSGFFDGDLHISGEDQSFTKVMVTEARRCTQMCRQRRRITEQEYGMIGALIEKEFNHLLEGVSTNCLVHADFNSKNILVDNSLGAWRVSGIIDWEFALSGPVLFDLGNFFRFEQEMPAYREAFMQAYAARVRSKLPNDWARKARLIELVPMLQFLCADVNTPKTFATALDIIRQMLGEFL